jgi:dolichyl-phosphate-mannose-protein mannosyltransferase
MKQKKKDYSHILQKIVLRVRNNTRWELAALVVGAAVTRVINLGTPNAVVFDEIYYVKLYTDSYFSHAYYFDVHPPLGKLLIAGWMWLFHISPASTTYGVPGSLRLFVALLGVAIIPLSYGIVWRLTKSRLAAGLAGLVIMLNGMLIVESRFVLLEGMLVFFGLAAIYAALRWYYNPKLLWIVLAGLLAGAAASIDWSGLTVLVLVLIVIIAGSHSHKLSWPKSAKRTAIILVLVSFVYLSSFWLHFELLSKSGTGDAFMSPAFQSTLIGNPYYQPGSHMSFWRKTIELNKEMYDANATIKGTDPYSSKWYTWPAETRPIYVWAGSVASNRSQGNIYLMSNPLTWWLSTLSVLIAMFVVLLPRLRLAYKKSLPALYFLLVAYFINWLPFAFITRLMFIYHYLFASVFSAMIMVVLINGAITTNHRWKKHRRLVIGSLLVITIGGFLYYSPLNYGWSLSPGQLHDRTFMHGWR